MMRQSMLMLWLLACSILSAVAQPQKTRVIDEGGSGKFKAVAVQEKALRDFVVYRPQDLLYAHARCGALPVLLFGNGGCADTSVGYERMLTEVASHGYVVVAIGAMQDSLNERPTGHAESAELTRGLDLLLRLNETKGSGYYHMIDTAKVAAAGHSCGGAQVLSHAADPRLKTYLILNAGMGDMEMAGASRNSLNLLHAPVFDISGYLRPLNLDFLKKDASAAWRQQTIADNDPITAIEHGSAQEVKAWRQVDWTIDVGDHDFTLVANMDLAKVMRLKGIPFSMYVDDGEHNGKWVQPALEKAILRANKVFNLHR